MNIQCDNCGTQHQLDPPSWVISSGRPFRFRCSACGNSQSVRPAGTVRSPADPPTVDLGPAPAPEPTPTVAPPALLDSPAPAPSRTETPTPLPPPVPSATPAPVPSATPPPAPEPTPAPAPSAGEVFLKQNGQIYSVRDWATLERWIVERRVDQSDLVSEGGVRWEPVGTRADLAPLFGLAAGQRDLTPVPGAPFGGDTPFGAPAAAEVWSDDDTEGIPVGLPPLPIHASPEDAATATPAYPRIDEVTASHPISRAHSLEVSVEELVMTPLPELGRPEPWELGLLEREPAESDVPEDDIDTPWHDPHEVDPDDEVTYAVDIDDGAPVEAAVEFDPLEEDDPEYDRDTDHRRPLSELDTESDYVDEEPSASGKPALARLAVVPSPHPSPHPSSRATPGASPQASGYARGPAAASTPNSVDGFAFDESTGPGPDRRSYARRPPSATPRPAANALADLSPADSITEVRRGPPPTASPLSPPREAPTLEPLTQLSVPGSQPGGSPAGEFPFDVEWDEETSRKRPRGRWLLAFAFVSTFLLLIVIAWFVGPLIGAAVVPDPHPDAPGASAPGASAPGASAHALGAPSPVPTEAAPSHAPAPPPVLKPAPVLPSPSPDGGAADPAPSAEPTESVAKLIKRGWDLADDDRPKAEKLFRRAVDLAPNDDEAAYGYGYVLLMQDRVAEATKYLCRARRAKRADTRQDVNGLIASRKIVCP